MAHFTLVALRGAKSVFSDMVFCKFGARPGDKASGLELFGKVAALDRGWQPSSLSNYMGLQAPSIKVEEEDVPQALVVKGKVKGEEVPQALTFSSFTLPAAHEELGVLNRPIVQVVAKTWHQRLD